MMIVSVFLFSQRYVSKANLILLTAIRSYTVTSQRGCLIALVQNTRMAFFFDKQ